MSDTNETVTTQETFGRQKAIVRWHGPLAAAFPTEAERKTIVGLFDEAMCAFNTVVFYVHYTRFGDQEIEWASTVNDDTDQIEIDATLASSFGTEGEIEVPEEVMEYLLWFVDHYNYLGAPPYIGVEQAEEEFHRYKQAKEDMK